MPIWRSLLFGLPHESHAFVQKATWMLSASQDQAGHSGGTCVRAAWLLFQLRDDLKNLKGQYVETMGLKHVETTNHQVATIYVLHQRLLGNRYCLFLIVFTFLGDPNGSAQPRSTLSANSKLMIISIIIHMSLENLTWNPVSSCNQLQPVVTCYDQLQSSGTGWQEGGQRTRHALKRDPKHPWQVSILATKKIEQHRLQDWYGCDWK